MRTGDCRDALDWALRLLISAAMQQPSPSASIHALRLQRSEISSSIGSWLKWRYKHRKAQRTSNPTPGLLGLTAGLSAEKRVVQGVFRRDPPTRVQG